MTDVVFKYVSWPFNQKDFRGNFIIENEHKVTKSTLAFPFNSLCESICRMRNYCARYCTSIDSDFDHIELRGLFEKKTHTVIGQSSGQFRTRKERFTHRGRLFFFRIFLYFESH